MLGHDATWSEDYADPATPGVAVPDSTLMEKAAEEGRLLITRDKELARRCEAAKVAFVHLTSDRVEVALSELARRLGLRLHFDPESARCPLCNHELADVPEDEDLDGQVPPGALKRAARFWRCTNEKCLHLFWEGTHVEEILATLERIKGGVGSAEQESAL